MLNPQIITSAIAGVSIIISTKSIIASRKRKKERKLENEKAISDFREFLVSEMTKLQFADIIKNSW